MFTVRVQTPRAKKAVDAAIEEKEYIGAAATRVAAQQAFGHIDATFALDGLKLDPEDRVGTRIAAGDRLELIPLGF